MRRVWVIDDEGVCWNESHRSLADRLRTNRAGPELTAFLLGQAGFVSVNEFLNRASVHFDDESVSPIALTGYLYWLTDHPFVPTTIGFVGDTTVSRVFYDRSELINFVGQTVERRRTRPEFSASPITMEQSSFALRWEAAREVFSNASTVDGVAGFFDALFQGRYVLAIRDDSNEFRIQLVGQNYSDYDSDFVKNNVGRTFRDAFDKDFGNWSADCFNLVSGSSAPVAERVNAHIEFPKISRKLYQYERLTLPLRNGSGRDYLLSAHVLL
jgi:hypothetical protein